jgi:DNA invertase Pin-like site-specific DNA recombinase
VTAEYTDTASGGRSSRKGLDAMMADVRRRRIDTIVVARLERLGRSLQHLVQLLAELEGVMNSCKK